MGQRLCDRGLRAFQPGVLPSLLDKASPISARWLLRDPGPGVLVPSATPIGLPFPTYAVQAATVGEVDPPLCGDAQWVKIYVAELDAPLTPEQLTIDNPARPDRSGPARDRLGHHPAGPASGCNGNCGNGVSEGRA
ncbi:MAG: hypothetical protein R3E53_04445 [Myxococcota bacterium]